MASPAPRISESAQLIPNPPTSVVESPKYSSHRAAPITHPTVKKIISDEAWSGSDGKIMELMVNDLHRRYDSADVLRDIYGRMFDFVL